MLNKINFLTAGESHGKGLLGILDNIPAGLEEKIDQPRLEIASGMFWI